MPNDPSTAGASGEPERIDPSADDTLHEWARRLDASPQQIREAVGAVGDRADDVEAYLKGTRSSANSERVHRAGERPG